MAQNLDPLWSDLSQATTSRKRTHRLDILGGRLREVRLNIEVQAKALYGWNILYKTSSASRNLEMNKLAKRENTNPILKQTSVKINDSEILHQRAGRGIQWRNWI